jgi:hypothetical protein
VADRWRRLASEAEERGAVEELRVGASEAEAQTSVEVIIDSEHIAERAEQADTARVGRFRSTPDNGPGTTKGISLQLVGLGAELIIAARQQMNRER